VCPSRPKCNQFQDPPPLDPHHQELCPCIPGPRYRLALRLYPGNYFLAPPLNNWSVCVQGVDLQAIIDDIRKLKIIVKGHERRIKSLEEQLALYDSQQQADYQWMLHVLSVSCLRSCQLPANEEIDFQRVRLQIVQVKVLLRDKCDYAYVPTGLLTQKVC